MERTKCFGCYYNSDNTCIKHEQQDNCDCYVSEEEKRAEIQKNLP